MPADRAALVDALRVCRRWIVEGQAQIGWSVDRIDEVLAAAALAAPPEAAPVLVAALSAEELAALDPGIRDTVAHLRASGFDTTDSGDGHSKPADWFASGEAMPFPHVAALTTPSRMVADAERMASVLGGGWVVEASYATDSQRAMLFARQDITPEAAPAPDCRAAVRAAVEAGWDDGVRFASEVLRSQVYPKAEARQACVERVLAILDAKLAALERQP